MKILVHEESTKAFYDEEIYEANKNKTIDSCLFNQL